MANIIVATHPPARAACASAAHPIAAAASAISASRRIAISAPTVGTSAAAMTVTSVFGTG
jgi:hypothetical protein